MRTNPPPILVHEAKRLEVLAQYDLTGAFPVDVYDPLLDLARHLFEVPGAYVSFAERDRQNLVVRAGLDIPDVGRDLSFDTHAIARGELFVVLDAALDPRFSDNPLVIGRPHVRFYAGMPLLSAAGYAIGTLSIIDTKPRLAFSDAERALLREVSTLVLDKLELHRLEHARQGGQAAFEQAAAASPDCVISVDPQGQITFWNAAAEWMFGFPAEEAVGKPVELILSPLGQGGLAESVVQRPRPRDGGLSGEMLDLQARHANGFAFLVASGLAVWGSEGEGLQAGASSYSMVLRNLRERQANEERLFRLAHRDALTELPNRAVLRSRIERLGQRHAPASLVVLSLEGLKSFNDGAGQAASDIVLKCVAERLSGSVRTPDLVARIRPEAFALLLANDGDGSRAVGVAEAAIQAIAEPIVLDGHTVVLGTCVGIAAYPVGCAAARDLLASADIALNQALAEGRNCYRVFTPALREAADQARAHESDLWGAYQHKEFEVFYQPQVRLSDGALVGAEALLRWRHPQDGLLSPAAFMPALERSPLSARVGEWVLQTACRQAAIWRRDLAGDFRIGVNLFSTQFSSGGLAAKVKAALAEAGLPASALELEITENILLRHDASMIAPLQELRDQGVDIAFDDYGTGYASLSMLKRFPITRLKVDQSFVGGLCSSPEDAAIVFAILYLGRSFGLSVIAEGVETSEQADRLRAAGCEEAQGYLFGRPMPASEFAALLAAQPRLPSTPSNPDANMALVGPLSRHADRRVEPRLAERVGVPADGQHAIGQQAAVRPVSPIQASTALDTRSSKG